MGVVTFEWVWLLIVLCMLYRLDVTFEPIFAELALYDVKERKKVGHLLRSLTAMLLT